MLISISAIAVDQNNLMGVTTSSGKQRLPRYVSEDFKFFKDTTMGSAIIMGRKTLESLPGILPGRPHIYLSRSSQSQIRGAHLTHTLPEAIKCAKQLSDHPNQYLIGGSEIIQLALDHDLIDEMLLTSIFGNFEPGDHPIYHPAFNHNDRERIELSEILTSQKSQPTQLRYQFIQYTKKSTINGL